MTDVPRPIVSTEGFNERPTASVPIENCLNEGVHPIRVCRKLCRNCAVAQSHHPLISMIDCIPQWLQVRVLVDHRGAQVSVTHNVANERWILCLCHRRWGRRRGSGDARKKWAAEKTLVTMISRIGNAFPKLAPNRGARTLRFRSEVVTFLFGPKNRL